MATRIFSVAFILLGIVIVVRTLLYGGGAFAVGSVLGLMFIALGVMRLMISR